MFRPTSLGNIYTAKLSKGGERERERERDQKNDLL
jgi:hypothetical protein